jgi:hypothetical protein
MMVEGRAAKTATSILPLGRGERPPLVTMVKAARDQA